MPKTAKILKKKIKTSEGLGMADLMKSLFSEGPKHTDIEIIKSKYYAYKECFAAFCDQLRVMKELLTKFEPMAEVLYNTISEGYTMYFGSAIDDSDQELFYENYSCFRNSNLIRYAMTMAKSILDSGIKPEGEAIKWDRVPVMAKQGILKLDIYNKLVDGLSAPYDLSSYYHAVSNTSKEDQSKLTSTLREIVATGRGVYKQAKTPDIQIDKLFEHLKTKLKSYKGRIRGINKLFAVLDSKGALFEQNFAKYYRNMINTGTPISMFTEFLTDVAHDSDIRDPVLVKESAIFLRELRKSMGPAPPSVDMGKINTIMDRMIELVEKNSELGEKEPLTADEVEKMINELTSKFGVV